MSRPGSSPALSGGGPGGLEPLDEGPRYETEGLLGVGGMGRVYAARDRKLRRRVAFKVAATPELSARLEREAWITAQLEHPGIVAVYDAGEEDGQAWYTMRLIRGRTLREALQQCAGVEQRLALLPHLHAACQAVAYAHSMGIVHRDLKPSNIMVGEFGETQVADWGLARPVDEALEDWERIVTGPAHTSMAGTARYMSPEQASGERVGFASDVFCLGAALYELVSGEAPPDEPGAPPDLGGLEATVPGDLLAIVRRCLRVHPAERYPSAVELAEDLARWLGGRRVRAHEYKPRELLWRLVQAWRAPLAVGVLASLALAAVIGVAVQRTAEERSVARGHLSHALTEQALSALLADRGPEAQVLAAHALGLEESPEARGVIAATAWARAERVLRVELPEACRHTARLDPRGERVACAADGRVEVWGLDPLERLWEWEVTGLGPPVWLGERVAVSTGERFVVLDEGRVVEERAGELFWFPGGEPGFVQDGGEGMALATGVHFPLCRATRPAMVGVAGRLLVGCDDGVLRSYDAEGRVDAQWSVHDERPPWSVLAPSPGGLLIGRLDGSVQELRFEDGSLSAPLHGFVGSVRSLRALPGSSLVVALGDSGGPRVWDREANAWVASLPEGASRVHEGPGRGEVFLVGESLELWRLPDSPRPSILQFGAGVSSVAVSPDGAYVAASTGVGEVLEREVGGGRLTRSWTLSDGVAKAVDYASTGLVGCAIGVPGARLGDEGVLPFAVETGWLRRLGGMADGRVWGLGYQGSALVFDAQGTLLSSAVLEAWDGSNSPDERSAVALGAEGRVWELVGQDWEARGQLVDAVAVDIDDDGAILVARRRELCHLGGGCAPLPDDAVDLAVGYGMAAVGTLAGEVLLLRLEDWRLLAVLRGHTGRVASVDYGPRGAWLASGSWDGSVRLWDLADLETPPDRLIERAEDTWGLSLEEALGSR